MRVSGDEADRPLPSFELWSDDIARMRKSARSARFVAVAGLVYTALMALAARPVIGRLFAPAIRDIAGLVANIATFATYAGGAALIWGYARALVSFIRDGEPTLALAFRRLRRFFQLWTVFVAFDIVWTIARRLIDR